MLTLAIARRDPVRPMEHVEEVADKGPVESMEAGNDANLGVPSGDGNVMSCRSAAFIAILEDQAHSTRSVAILRSHAERGNENLYVQ